MNIKKVWRENRALFIMIAVTAVAITASAIIFKQPPFRVLPLYNSLIIMAMNARANRFALIYGGVNSILYALVDVGYGLYGSAAYAMLVSFPIQIVTFILYNRRKYGNSTLYRKMPWLWRGVTAVGFGVCWVGVILVLRALGGSHTVLDTTVTLFGFLITGLTMFAFIEAPILNIVSSLVSIALNVSIVVGGAYDRTSYLIYSVYCIICVVLGAIRTVKLYKEQQLKKREKEKNEGCLA